MKKIENAEDLNEFLVVNRHTQDDECILRVYDNKSDVLLQTVVVKHPVIFVRGLQEFCKSVSLPVSDVVVYFIGFVSPDSNLSEISDIVEISPYVYFNKPTDDNDSSKDN